MLQNTHKALVYTDTQTLEYRNEPFPNVATGEALVRIDAVGICGSDMHAYHGHDARRIPPLVLGHEACGQVVSGRFAGQKVTLNPIAFCGYCDYCLAGQQNLCSNRSMIGMSRPGAFAQFVSIPEQCLIPLPDDMNPIAAALTEPAATALHATDLAAKAARKSFAESTILVIGAGSIGILIALLLKLQGCRGVFISETNSLRCETARNAQAGTVINPLEQTLDDNSFDIVFDAVGAANTREVAINGTKPGGVIIHVGLLQGEGNMNVRKLTLAEISFIGAYTYSQLDLKRAADLLYLNRLGALDWVTTRPLAEGFAAFKAIHSGLESAAKIVLIPEKTQ